MMTATKTLTNAISMSRNDFLKMAENLDLNDRENRQMINRVVIDEIIKTRYKVKYWEVNGCPPLNCSGTEYLRPCPECRYGSNGWKIHFSAEWFCD